MFDQFLSEGLIYIWPRFIIMFLLNFVLKLLEKYTHFLCSKEKQKGLPNLEFLYKDPTDYMLFIGYNNIKQSTNKWQVEQNLMLQN